MISVPENEPTTSSYVMGVVEWILSVIYLGMGLYCYGS